MGFMKPGVNAQKVWSEWEEINKLVPELAEQEEKLASSSNSGEQVTQTVYVFFSGQIS